MRILVTDLTEMATDMCLAGWCAEQQRMVRPLPAGRNWSRALVEGLALQLGSNIKFRAGTNESVGIYPHKTEDLLIGADDIVVEGRQARWWVGGDAPPTADTLTEAFEGQLLDSRRYQGVAQGPRVAEGVETRSLWAINVDRHQLTFFEDDFQGKKKLKVRLDDGDDRYDISVSSAELKSAYNAHGVRGVEQSLSGNGRLHVRVGLARASDKTPNQCVVMINGVFR